ncbi:winged helix DNA-binding domain-containing protein [Actinoplanes sp. DH11]|uniref:winged helix DNA-binding domain-containing protein n=1 Tax=Actinoplanes sp. DH11 TaxID=2857011 RepID=UPI001E3AE3C2|nr:winged helix DNA-binding domain-containing protein [Actinoplanes sp. DH11]
MDSSAALSLRLTSLLLGPTPAGAGASGPHPTGDVPGVVAWFGAMQAQDLNSVLWSLGARLPHLRLPDVVAATEDRSVVRTWPMRGTVHLVPSADAHWMLDLTGVRQLTGVARRWAHLGLDEKIAGRSMELLAAALTGAGGRLTRSACLAALREGGIDVSGQRGYHLLWYAAQRSLTAIAPNDGAEQTFVLLDDWVPERFTPSSREEALAILAGRYFRSHGPATVKDFAGWTGLGLRESRAGIAAAGLVAVDVQGDEMWADPAVLDAGPVTGWWALPGFDEFMLGYKDRSMMATTEQLSRIVPGGNGVFQSTIVRDGRVVGAWKRTIGAKAVTVTVTPFATLPDADVEAALAGYAAYLDLPLIVKNP